MREQLYACEPNHLLAYLERIENASDADVKIAAAYGNHDEDDPLDDIYQEDGDEATVKVTGMLTQGPFPFIARLFGIEGTSYQTIGAALDKAKTNPVIKRLHLAVNSPGGEAGGGLDQLWGKIRAWGKNCRATNLSLCASAAYYLASACDKISAASPMCEQGSIGIIAAGIDDSEAMKRDGKKKITLTSKNAPNKAMGFDSKDGRDRLQARMDALEGMFLARVSEGRGLPVDYIKANFGQGAVMMAEHPKGSDAYDSPCALSVRMIDSVGSPAIPDSNSRKMGMQMHASSNGGKKMNLNELFAANPDAKAEFDTAISAATAAGAKSVQARIDAAKPFLAFQVTKDGYNEAEVDQIAKCAIEVMAGVEEPSGLRSFVRMVDLQKSQRIQAAAEAETHEQGETPGHLSTPDDALMAEAAKFKIDVPAFLKACADQKLDPVTALTAEIENARRSAELALKAQG
jgi:ClpP class serine protease